MLELIGFHALGEKDLHEADLAVVLEKAAHECGLACRRVGASELLIEAEGRPALAVSWPKQPRRLEFAVGPVDRGTLDEWGPAAVADLVKRLWTRAGVELGRSFRGGGAGHGIVTESELEGALEFVDWIQYLSPRLAARWSRSVIETAPFYRVEPMDDGGWFLCLGQDPFESLMSRREAAAHLGIHLRPLFGRGMNGRTIEFDWP